MLTQAPSELLDRRLTRQPHAVVIGSGFGGLAAAVRLGARGYRVTVLERLDAPGGRAYTHKIDGFTFDAGPTIVTAPFLFEELWEMCGRKFADDIDLRAMNPFYRLRFDNGETFDYCGDAAAMRAEIGRFSPGDVDGYDRLLKASEDIFRIGFEELGDKPFSSVLDMARAAPDILRLGGLRSVYNFVARYMKDERLRTIFSFHPLLIGANPFAATSIYVLIAYLERQWGVHSVIGGTGKLVSGLVGLIQGQGGIVRCNAEVAQICVEGGRARGVRLADGEIVAADVVVSNACTAWTYLKMLPPECRKTFRDARLQRASYSMSLFVWYFGTNRKYDDVLHHSILFGPRYRGLLNDIFVDHKLADDFSLYLHRPSASDPSVAPEGHDAFYVLSPVPNLNADVDWSTEAEVYRKRVEAYLEATVLPDLSKHIVASRMTTPIDFRDRLLSWEGAAFGMEPILTQSAWFRPHNKSDDIEGLYLVGAGTHPGAGLPGVLSSARILDRIVPHAATLA
ncbi:MAG: phytoene desaturase [Rhodoblastus sp.]